MLWFPTFLGKPYEEIKSYECTNMRQISTPNSPMLTKLVIGLPSVETLSLDPTNKLFFIIIESRL